MRRMTGTERRLDAAARRFLGRLPSRGAGGVLVEVLAFGAKQAWACVFGGALLAVLLAARLWYPDDAPLARNDALTVAALVIQVLMLVFRLETLRELRVILLFHLVGTVMEVFKTDVGSWTYDADGVLRIGGVPLFSGFMYAAVGSYLVRVYRLFDLRFERYPRQWLCLMVAGLIYVNFFTHHVLPDIRLALFLAVVLVWGRATMHVRVFRARLRMPVLLAFLLVALFIWFAENIATWSDAWSYPDQLDGWQPVSIAKLGSWFLLMIISVALVTWVYPAQVPDAEPERADSVADPGRRVSPGE